jgi:hypothetical protein
MYKVIRFYRSGKKKTILRGVNLEVAQLHCNSEKTHKKDSKGNIIWFDGYNQE